MSALLTEINELAQPERHSAEEAEALARGLMAQGQRVSELFLLALQSANPPEPACAERMVALLRRLTAKDRLVQLLDRAIPAAHPGSRERLRKVYDEETRDLSWVAEAMAQKSPRHAANVIESLWRVEPSEELRRILLEAAGSESNNRLVGNALVGLFRLQDEQATILTLKALHHEDGVFRATAAWVVGRVGWNGGSPKLQKLVTGDADDRVRKNAVRSLQRLRRLQTRVA